MDLLFSNLDWVYLAVLFFSDWILGDKKIYAWYFRGIGSILGIIFGSYMALWGIVFWNALFLITTVRGFSKWRKNDT